MPRRPDQMQPPRAYVAADGVWPHGPWAPGTPAAVLYAAGISERLEQGIWDAGLTIADAARQIGVARRTLHATLSGQVMPDLRTVALAEQALGVRLWPDRLDLPHLT